jgi:hypothetical protein
LRLLPGGSQDAADRAASISRTHRGVGGAVDRVIRGRLFEDERFCTTPPGLRRLNDIAFSGDGEPTTCPQFRAAVEAAAELRRRRALDDMKLVLITNATRFHDRRVAAALEVLDTNNGEIWAKLDAGTEEYYHEIERTTIPSAACWTTSRPRRRFGQS